MEAPVVPVCLLHSNRRDQHAPAGEPAPGIHDQIADRPVCIVEEELLDVADITIRRSKGEALQLVSAA